MMRAPYDLSAQPSLPISIQSLDGRDTQNAGDVLGAIRRLVAQDTASRQAQTVASTDAWKLSVDVADQAPTPAQQAQGNGFREAPAEPVLTPFVLQAQHRLAPVSDSQSRNDGPAVRLHLVVPPVVHDQAEYAVTQPGQTTEASFAEPEPNACAAFAGQDDYGRADADFTPAPLAAQAAVADTSAHPAPSRVSASETDVHLFAGDDDDLATQAILRSLIRDALRQELEGDLGGRLSRNLRQMIRQEIRGALQDLRD